MDGFEKDQLAILDALTAAGNSDDEKLVARILQHGVKSGVPLFKIALAIKGTCWRYRLNGNGSDVVLISKDQLIDDYAKLFDEMCTSADFLARCGYVFGPRSLNNLEPLGVACHELAVHAKRAIEYLLPEDEQPNVMVDVAKFLSGSGFSWDGDYEVERFPGENREILETAKALSVLTRKSG